MKNYRGIRALAFLCFKKRRANIKPVNTESEYLQHRDQQYVLNESRDKVHHVTAYER